ncbi:hypothetical protein AcV7_005471 [Taiwanofungus camphoratus]|nr:hypothetical protein AcV7_005471 [Antrodia cinnamomea]
MAPQLNLTVLDPMPFIFHTAHLTALINMDKAWDMCPRAEEGVADGVYDVMLDEQ